MSAVRPGDQATATILAMQAELTALGLLPPGDGTAPAMQRIAATGRAPEQPCGTEAAAQRHRRRREPICDQCRTAERIATNERHQRAATRKAAA